MDAFSGDSRTLLLIGARGFIGGYVREAAQQAGLRVVTAGRGETGDELRCDLLEPRGVVECVSAAAPDLVVNMAGAASVAASWEDPAASYAINAIGVLNLLEAIGAAAPAAHLLCMSSAQVYGEVDADRLPLGEEAAVEPVTPYGAAKAAMEVVCGQQARAGDRRIAVIRAFNQIGPGLAPPFAGSGFAKRIAEAELAGARSARLAVGDPEAARDFTDVRDGAQAIVEASRRELAGTFNLCSGRATRLRDLIEWLGASTDLEIEIELDPSLGRPADPSVVYGSNERLREASGWAPEIPLEQTLADLLDWWRITCRDGN